MSFSSSMISKGADSLSLEAKGALNQPETAILHHNDPDGFGAAWVAHDHLPEAEYVEIDYNRDFGVELAGRPVFFLDYHPDKGDLLSICEEAEHVFVIDHHESGAFMEGLDREDLTVKWVEGGKSAIRLAWEFFYPGAPASWVVDYVEDRDLWNWDLPNSRPVNAYLYTYQSKQAWDRAALLRPQSASPDWAKIVKQGEAVLANQDALANDIINESLRRVRWEVPEALPEVGGETIEFPVVNAPILRSEVGEKISKGELLAAVIYKRQDGRWKVSLRSDRDTDKAVHVGRIATPYPGGGGHRHAAGFTPEALPWE